MTAWRVATHSWLHTFLGWNGPYYLLALHMFFRFLKITGRPKLFHFSFFFFPSKTRTSGSFIFFKFQETGTQGYYQCWAVLECPPHSQTGSHNEN